MKWKIMKLIVIVRNIYGEFWGGLLEGNMRYTPPYTKELIPNSLVFKTSKRIYKKEDVPKFDKFVTVNEFRKKCNGKLPVKFSQVILDSLGFDRIWIYRECVL